MKRIVAASALLTAATIVSAQPNQPYNCVRDSELRPVFCTGLRPIVTAEMGIPIGTPFFDSSTSALYYWSGSSWAALNANALFPDGTASAPSIAFASSPTTGFYLGKAGTDLSTSDQYGNTFDGDSLLRNAPACEWVELGCAGITTWGTQVLPTTHTYDIARSTHSVFNISGTQQAGKDFTYTAHDIFIGSTAATPAGGSVAHGLNYRYNGTSGGLSQVYGAQYYLNTSADDKYVAGVYTVIAASAEKAHDDLIGTYTYLEMGDNTSVTNKAVVQYIWGPSQSTDGTDSSKIYKTLADGYGRSLINQPRDTDYALELTNGQGLSVSGKTNQLQLSKAAGGAKPACASGTRGSFWYEPGGTDVKDTVEVCAKDGANAYAWRTIY